MPTALEYHGPNTTQEVTQYQEKYEGISILLDANTALTALAHANLVHSLSELAREA